MNLSEGKTNRALRFDWFWSESLSGETLTAGPGNRSHVWLFSFPDYYRQPRDPDGSTSGWFVTLFYAALFRLLCVSITTVCGLGSASNRRLSAVALRKNEQINTELKLRSVETSNSLDKRNR